MVSNRITKTFSDARQYSVKTRFSPTKPESTFVLPKEVRRDIYQMKRFYTLDYYSVLLSFKDIVNGVAVEVGTADEAIEVENVSGLRLWVMILNHKITSINKEAKKQEKSDIKSRL